MMKTRSLRLNAWTSVFASASVFGLTLLQTAILARGLLTSEYRIYSLSLALLPFLLLPIQSVRTCAGSALTIMRRTSDGDLVKRSFGRFLLFYTFLSVLLGLIAIAGYLSYLQEGSDNILPLALGLMSVVIYTVGISASVYISGIATSIEDFLPDNILKVLPPFLFLAWTMLTFQNGLAERYYNVIAAFALSPWLVAVGLYAYYLRTLDQIERTDTGYLRHAYPADIKRNISFLFKCTLPVVWWNVTAYFSTAVSIAVVAAVAIDNLVPYSMAFLLVGLLSGGLIAVSSPIVSRIAQLGDDQIRHRLQQFLRLNRYFAIYITLAVAALMLCPEFLFELWVSSQYASEVQLYTKMLLPAAAIRLLTMCFTLFILSTGRQAMLWLSPTCEAAVATGTCVVLGAWFGIAGIALGLTLSATIRLALTIAYDIKQHEQALPITPRDLLFPFGNRVPV